MISAPNMDVAQWQTQQAQHWQMWQPTTCAQPMTQAAEAWIGGPPAMAQQHSQPMMMVPVVPQPNFPANGFSVNGVPMAMCEPSQAFMVSQGQAAMVQGSATQPCHWQPESTACTMAPAPQVVVLMRVCTAGTSAPYSQPAWQQVPPCPSTNFGDFVPAVAFHSSGGPQPSVAPVQLELAEHVEYTSSGYFSQHAKECSPEWDDSDYDLSECGHPGDAFTIPRDAKSYASSDTASTTVSRSARRRRGRRSAKATASKNSMVILETPAAADLLVTEEDKKELMQKLEASDEDTVRKAVSSLRGSVVRMSLEPFGCRIVQKALDVASAAEKDCLTAELRDNVKLAICSPHGNFVIQKVIEVLPVKSASFVAEELATFAAEVSRHRFGCRVLSRLVEHHLCSNGDAPSTDILIDEVLLEIDQLIHHNFARHVLELILEHGTEAHKQKIAKAVRGNLFHYAKNRFASYVVEKTLALCKAADTHPIASELLSDPERFLMLAVHECGTHVVKAVMKSHADCAEKAKELLNADSNRVKASKYGKRLLDEM